MEIHMVQLTTARYSERGLLEHIAEQNAQILNNQEKQLALEQDEQDALDAASAALTKLGGDISIVLQAKDNQINSLTTQLSAALAAQGVSATQIAAFQAQIAQQTQASNDAATQIKSAFGVIATTITSLDATVIADTPAAPTAPSVTITPTVNPVVPVPVPDPTVTTLPVTPVVPDTVPTDPTTVTTPTSTDGLVESPVVTTPVAETPPVVLTTGDNPTVTSLT
jgi:hypothetical protein